MKLIAIGPVGALAVAIAMTSPCVIAAALAVCVSCIVQSEREAAR